MKFETIISVAISADGYMDDTSKERLVLSNDEDWAQVYELRAQCDAILIGAETLRMDNPSLSIKDKMLRDRRICEGKPTEPAKIVVTGSGRLDSGSRFFTTGSGERIVVFLSDTNLDADIESSATVIRLERISANAITEAIEANGIHKLMIEGGAKIIDLFLRENAVDTMRMAVNPMILDQAAAPRFNRYNKYIEDKDSNLKLIETQHLGDMNIYAFIRKDVFFLEKAIEVSRNCVPCQRCYRVGAVIVTRDGSEFYGYTGETSPINHAEEEAFTKAQSAGADLKGATIYTSMEPCSQRSSKEKSCSRLIIEHGISSVIFALLEPIHFVTCHSIDILQKAGISVTIIDTLAPRVLEINKHLDLE